MFDYMFIKDTRGRLQRKHVVIDASSIHYIGKETNELEVVEVIGVDPESYAKYIHWKS